jgi:DNA-binding CsgD family transcriptional regulator
MGAVPLVDVADALSHRAGIVLDAADDPVRGASAARRASPFGLTRREREVLVHVAAGRTNRQIAEALFIGERTAGIHVSNILGKLGVARRTEAAAVAHRLGLGASPGGTSSVADGG